MEKRVPYCCGAYFFDKSTKWSRMKAYQHIYSVYAHYFLKRQFDEKENFEIEIYLKIII